MTNIATESGSIEYTCVINPTSNAGTTIANANSTVVPISTVMLWRMMVRIPPGPAGLTGIALVDGGIPIIPYPPSPYAWVTGDDEEREFPYNKELGANITLLTWNTGIFDHSWLVYLIYTPWAALEEEGGSVIVTPAPPDWLAGAAGD